MKMLSIIISLLTALIFTVAIISSHGAILDINAASVAPLFLVFEVIYLGYRDITFEKSEKDMLHPNEADFNYSERVEFYKNRGIFLLSNCVMQIFLMFCFKEMTKSFICVLSFMLTFGIATFLSGYKIKDVVKERLAREEAELKEQESKEEEGRI